MKKQKEQLLLNSNTNLLQQMVTDNLHHYCKDLENVFFPFDRKKEW